MRRKVHIHVHTIDNTFKESEHKRDSDGKFTTVSGGPHAGKRFASLTFIEHVEQAEHHLTNNEKERGAAHALQAELDHKLSGNPAAGVYFGTSAEVESRKQRARERHTAIGERIAKAKANAATATPNALSAPAAATAQAAPAAKPAFTNSLGLAEGQAIYDAKGQKVDEILAVAPSPWGKGGKRIHTRAGYVVDLDHQGNNDRGWTNKKP